MRRLTYERTDTRAGKKHLPGGGIIRLLAFSAVFVLFTLFTAVPNWAAERGYRVGPGDVLNLILYAGGEEQLNVDLTVESDGTIVVPMLGSVKADGLTLPTLKNAISSPMAADYFVDPQILLTIKEYHSLSIQISGAVQKPGIYAMDKEPSVLELIGKAGGLKPGHGQSAFVIRSLSDENAAQDGEDDNDALVVDLMALFTSGGNQGNIRLRAGDVVKIPLATETDQSKNSIFIEGEVKNPGIYTFQPGLTTLGACIMAGGFSEFAAPNRTKVIRKNDTTKEVLKIDLEDVKDGTVADLTLQPGDFILVPETWF